MVWSPVSSPKAGAGVRAPKGTIPSLSSESAAGQVSVSLTGADPSTNYELFFRPLDNSGDVDTGIALATNAVGNVQKGPKAFFPADAVASGTFVVKRQDSETEDQFVSGYKLN